MDRRCIGLKRNQSWIITQVLAGEKDKQDEGNEGVSEVPAIHTHPNIYERRQVYGSLGDLRGKAPPYDAERTLLYPK